MQFEIRGWTPRLLVVCVCLGAGAAGAAESDPAPQAPLPAEAFFQRPAIRDIKLSPSGRQLAFTTGKGLEHVGLTVMNLDGEPKTTHWVAALSDADVREFHWVNDDRLVYTAIELDEGSASDHHIAPGLYSAKSDGAQQRQLVQRYRCGVEWVGVADMELLLKGSWWVSDHLADTGRCIKAPLLMAYGDGDKRVPIAHGERMKDALTKAGHPPEWIAYEGEGHGWRTVEHQVDFAKRVEAFLAKNLPVDPPAAP
ncbi:MAG: prolyl oligopeptidase family serine peptidase [Burkholderiaceae bacterium]|nr:prolyl oligopeptidase family serine peptidase [Roseateles sp.]MBV8471201.1 prolyl oligopeptidase family serine peptidase [Burkholderiaceae bacterium]